MNEAYENALRQFIRLCLERRDGNPFPAEVAALARRMARFGFLNSLAQTLCKITAPGVPDIYQGTEIWDWSLVDPDNRRPVDYVKRRRLLDEVKSWGAGSADSLPERLHQALDTLDDGRCKLYLIATALEFRRARAALFRDGSYLPLRVVGKYAVHVLAFARKLNDEVTLVAVPRLCFRLLGDRHLLPLGAEVWLDTRIELPRKLAASAYRNLMDGTTIPVASREGTRSLQLADLMANWPCALLTS